MKRSIKSDMSRPIWILCAVGVVGFIINTAIFYPGYMSNDTIAQLGQALHVYEPTDMLPLAMMLMWRFLIAFTGHTAAMLIWQLLMFWTALILLAVYTFKKTQSLKFSFAPFAIAFLPFIVNISGVIWKDNQMAYALLLAVVATLYFSYIETRWKKTLLLSGIVLLMAYACLVRYNAIIAIVPLIFLAVRQSGLIKRFSRQVISTAGVCGIIAIMFIVMNAATHVRSSNPISFVMIDDIANVAPEQLPDTSGISEIVRQDLLSIRRCAREKGTLVNNYWVCAREEQRLRLSGPYYDEVRAQWIKIILHYPADYSLYKIRTYGSFLFPAEGAFYIWQNGIQPNEFGQEVKYPQLGKMIENYTMLTYRYLSFLFEPWFWLVVAWVLFAYMKRCKYEGFIEKTILLSAFLYLLSYFPTGATVDYRFIYWTVLACLVVILLIMYQRVNTTKQLRNTKDKLIVK